MYNKKFKRHMSMLISTALISSMIFSFNTKAETKPRKAPQGGAIMGNTLFTYNAQNALKALKEAAQRGLTDKDLDVYYTLNDGANKRYYNFTKKISKDETQTEVLKSEIKGEDIWENVTGKYDPETDKFIPYDDAKKSSDSRIIPKEAFKNIITIEDNKITVPEGFTVETLKAMTQPAGNNKSVSQDYSLNAEKTVLKVTAEDGSYSEYNISVNENKGEGVLAPELETNFKDTGTISYKKGEEWSRDPLKVEVTNYNDLKSVEFKWYKQQVKMNSETEQSSFSSRISGEAEEIKEGVTTNDGISTYTPNLDDGTNLYYVIVTNTEDGKTASSVSEIVAVVVSNPNLEKATVAITDYTHDEYTNGNADVKWQVYGTATKGATVTVKFKIDGKYEGVATATADETTGEWTTDISRQNGGARITATAISENNSESDEAKLTVPSASDSDKAILGNLIKKIEEKLENVHISEDGTKDVNGNELKDGDKYLNQTSYDALNTLKDLLKDIKKYEAQLSKEDINFIKTDATKAYDEIEVNIKGVSNDVKITLGTVTNGTIQITTPSGLTPTSDRVYTVENGSKVVFKVIPNSDEYTVINWKIGDASYTSSDSSKGITLSSDKTELTIEKVTDAITVTPTLDLKTAKTITVERQSDELTEGTGGTVTFDVTTTNIADGVQPTITWATGNAPAGVTATVSKISNNKAKVTVTTTNEAKEGTYNFTLTADSKTSDNVTLTIGKKVATEKTIEVEAQSADLTAGTAGTATFNVTTTNIADGVQPTITWATGNAPTGVTATVSKISNNEATVTVTTTDKATNGTYNFTVTADGKTSDEVTLTIKAANVNVTLGTVENGTIQITEPSNLSPTTTGGKVYAVESGSKVVFKVTPNSGYKVESWTVGSDNNITATDTSKGITLEENNTKLTIAKVEKAITVTPKLVPEETTQEITAIKITKIGKETTNLTSVCEKVYAKSASASVYIYAQLNETQVEFDVTNSKATITFDLGVYGNDSDNKLELGKLSLVNNSSDSSNLPYTASLNSSKQVEVVIDSSKLADSSNEITIDFKYDGEDINVSDAIHTLKFTVETVKGTQNK